MYLLDNLGSKALPITVHSGEGALLFDTGGRSYWDFYGGHAVTLLGQGHPAWVDALTRQARQLSFFTTLGPVPVRSRAAEVLCRFTGMDVAFFVNSGAEANEAALKLARKATGRGAVVAMKGGFHGRTMGALGVTDGYRTQHLPAHGDTRFVPFGDLGALEGALDDDVAAVILEPVQGIAGIVEPPAGYLRAAAATTRAAGALLICDEVQCGVGRMGVPTVSGAAGVRPDVLTLGKGLGGGFPVAATLMTREVAETAAPGEHGTTFGGGPLAAAAVVATLGIVEDEGLLQRATFLGELMQRVLRVEGVQSIRGAGVWLGLVLDRPARPVAAELLDRGFLVGTAADPRVLRLSPPAVLPTYAVDLLASALHDVLEGRPHAAVG